MTDSPKDYREFAGFVLFPRSADDLVDTGRCPACLMPLTAVVCTNCGLDLTGAAASELAEASSDAAAALDRRLSLIGRLRHESAQEAAQSPVAVPPIVAAVETPVEQVATPLAPPIAPQVAQPATLPPQPTTPRRQISVQVVLLLVGVALLSIGAIFFLVYAFINFGLVWRSLIILAVTVTAFVAASLLKKRHLAATAESVAVLAVVLTYLDSFAVRANDLLVVGDPTGFLHWGATLLLSAAGFLVWSRFSSLRVPGIVGFAAIGPGLALLVLGLTDGMRHDIPSYLAMVAWAIGSLAHPLASRLSPSPGRGLPERYILLAMAALALLGAGNFATVFIDPPAFASTVALLVVALVAAAHVDLALRTQVVPWLTSTFAAIGGIAAAASFAVAGDVASPESYGVIVPVLAAAATALALDTARSRLSGAARVAARSAMIAAAAVAVIAAINPLGRVIFTVLDAIELSTPLWGVSGAAQLDLSPYSVLTVVALAAVICLSAAVWALQRVLRKRTVAIVWSVIALALLAVPLASVLWLIVTLWMLLALAGTAFIVFRPTAQASTRLAITIGSATTLALSYFCSWGSTDTWLIGTVGAVAALLLATRAVSSHVVRAGLISVAVVAVLVAAGAGAWLVQNGPQPSSASSLLANLAVAVVAALLILSCALFGARVSAVERVAVFWVSLTTALVSTTMLWISSVVAPAAAIRDLVVPANVVLAAQGLLLLVALLVWIQSTSTETLRPERVTAAVSLAPVLAWCAITLTLLFGVPSQTGTLSTFVVVAMLLLSAAALAIARFSPGLNLRLAVDAGASIVTATAVACSVIVLSDLTWIVLTLAAIFTLILAVSVDGLFASTSARKYLGWLSLALGIAGLVWLLSSESVRDAAFYVLPPAGALLLIAAAAWFSARRRQVSSSTAPWITLAGLVLALVPLAVVHSRELSSWLIAVVSLSAVLLLTATILRVAPASRRYLDAAGIAGALGLVASAYGHSFVLATGGSQLTELVIWLAVTLAIFTISAIAYAPLGDGALRATTVSQVLFGIPLAATLVFGLAALPHTGSDTSLPATSLVVLFAVVLSVCAFVDRAPFTMRMGWIALALAVAAWLISSSLDRLTPLEWATVPIAAALLFTGGVRLRRDPAARSWPWLSPGILMLIVPSLLASFVDEPVWRLVGIGVASIAAIIAGALLRLQAPLVLGSVLVLAHAVRTFAPQIVAVYQLTEWWVWAVVGGAIIFFIGFTFEKRKRDFQSAATKVTSLR